MTIFPLTVAAATALVAPLQKAIAAGSLDQADIATIRPLVEALDAAVRTEHVDHGDIQRYLYEALDVDHEWWRPEALRYALNSVEYAIRSASNGTIERT